MKVSSFIPVLALSVLVSSPLVAQLKVELGPEMSIPKGDVYNAHVYSDASGNYILKSHYKSAMFQLPSITPAVEHYGLDNKLDYTVVFPTDKIRLSSGPFGMNEDNDKDALLYKAVPMKKQLYLTYVSTDFSEKKVVVSAVPVSAEGKAEATKELFTLNWVDKNDNPYVKNTTSADKSKILFFTFTAKKKEDKKNEVYIAVHDDAMNPLWDKQMIFPYSTKQMFIKDALVSNSGQVFLYCMVYNTADGVNTKENQRSHIAGYQMVVYRISKDMKEPQEIAIKDPSHYLTSNKLVFDKGEKNVISIDMYSSDSENDPIEGYIYNRIDCGTGNIVASKAHRFTKEELSVIDDATRKGKNDDQLAKDYTINFMAPQNDGSLLLMAECKASRVVTSTLPNAGAGGANSTSSSIIYNYEDIAVVKISDKGELDWFRVIPKSQSTSDDKSLLGYVVVEGNNSYHVIYNDVESNIAKPLNKRPNVWHGGTASIAQAEVKLNGDITRKVGYKFSSSRYNMLPKMCHGMGKNKIFLLGTKQGGAFSSGKCLIGVATIE